MAALRTDVCFLEYYVIVSPYRRHPEWYVNKTFRNTVLVSTWNDHETNSLIVRAAKKAHVSAFTVL